MPVGFDEGGSRFRAFNSIVSALSDASSDKFFIAVVGASKIGKRTTIQESIQQVANTRRIIRGFVDFGENDDRDLNNLLEGLIDNISRNLAAENNFSTNDRLRAMAYDLEHIDRKKIQSEFGLFTARMKDQINEIALIIHVHIRENRESTIEKIIYFLGILNKNVRIIFLVTKNGKMTFDTLFETVMSKYNLASPIKPAILASPIKRDVDAFELKPLKFSIPQLYPNESLELIRDVITEKIDGDIKENVVNYVGGHPHVIKSIYRNIYDSRHLIDVAFLLNYNSTVEKHLKQIITSLNDDDTKYLNEWSNGKILEEPHQRRLHDYGICYKSDQKYVLPTLIGYYQRKSTRDVSENDSNDECTPSPDGDGPSNTKNASFEEICQTLKEHLDSNNDSDDIRLVDYGCGWARFPVDGLKQYLPAMLEKISYIGVDCSSKTLEKAKELFENYFKTGLDRDNNEDKRAYIKEARFKTARDYFIYMHPETVDVVAIISTLHDLQLVALPRILYYSFLFLKPGGLLVIYDKSEASKESTCVIWDDVDFELLRTDDVSLEKNTTGKGIYAYFIKLNKNIDTLKELEEKCLDLYKKKIIRLQTSYKSFDLHISKYGVLSKEKELQQAVVSRQISNLQLQVSKFERKRQERLS